MCCSNKPLVYGSVQRFDGQVSVFNRTPTSLTIIAICCRNPLRRTLFRLARMAGVMGVMPGLIGLIQATEAIKLITGDW